MRGTVYWQRMYTWLLVSVFFSRIDESFQACYTQSCPHHEQDLVNCVHGDWLCQADEFCEIATHPSHNPHSNSPWHILDCRPMEDLADCLASNSHNDAACDPNRHDRVCHWCCTESSCVQQLATGHYVAPSIPTTTTGGAVVTQSQPAVATTTTATTTTSPPPSPTSDCQDTYAGDCLTEFKLTGRCDESRLIQYQCARTCNAC